MILGNELCLVSGYDVKTAISDIDGVKPSLENDSRNESRSHSVIFFVFIGETKDKRVGFGSRAYKRISDKFREFYPGFLQGRETQ